LTIDFEAAPVCRAPVSDGDIDIDIVIDEGMLIVISMDLLLTALGALP